MRRSFPSILTAAMHPTRPSPVTAAPSPAAAAVAAAGGEGPAACLLLLLLPLRGW